ncbi:hypothetical protein F4810DRAFT_618246 [Camillea tinctor]|nr:hypothetical protein F4810DRAFT_618246 [Camillea tinctor]
MPEYVRITSSGRPQFVRSHSFSHHHHHHRTRYVPRCPENCAAVTVEQWDTVCAQNTALQDTNGVLTRDKESLKAELAGAAQELARLRDTNARLDSELLDLRRRPAGERERLEREVGVLNVRVRELSRTVDVKDAEITNAVTALKGWRRRCEDLERRYERELHHHHRAAEGCHKKVIIEEQHRVRRRDPFAPHRRQWVTFA